MVVRLDFGHSGLLPSMSEVILVMLVLVVLMDKLLTENLFALGKYDPVDMMVRTKGGLAPDRTCAHWLSKTMTTRHGWFPIDGY